MQSQDGRVGLRRQFQVLVRKGMGSNPILDKKILFRFRYFCELFFFVCATVLLTFARVEVLRFFLAGLPYLFLRICGKVLLTFGPSEYSSPPLFAWFALCHRLVS